MNRVVASVFIVAVFVVVVGVIIGAAGPRRHAVTPSTRRCQDCHTPDGWLPARFAHDKTGFALVGRHDGVACASCHDADYTTKVPTSCAGCHQDVHGGELGAQCRSCHDERSFQPLFNVDAHRRTNFPLIGRHAAVRCEQCHVEKRERTFSRVTLPCTACHAAAATRASTTTVNHRGFVDCRECHLPT
ncbi:MAG TPA: cytochrome c3 family protein, partial [Myxococcota bacterium]